MPKLGGMGIGLVLGDWICVEGGALDLEAKILPVMDLRGEAMPKFHSQVEGESAAQISSSR